MPTILSILLLFNGCTLLPQTDNPSPLFQRSGYEFPYQLNEPDDSWILPQSLVEISGIGYTDEERLACIQDEKGIIFIYNLRSRKIEHEFTFGEDADYEDINIIDPDAWVLKSNGTLYRVTDYLDTAKSHTSEFPTALSGRNNTEGLAYDPVKKNLLIACKGSPSFNKEETSQLKAVYIFNPEIGKLDKDPFLMIDPDSILHYKVPGTTARGIKDKNHAGQGKGNEPFMPSGIAIHPLTGDIYVLGSVGHLLLVYSPDGEMLAMTSLNHKMFPQPEGICFSPDGKLYISSEGKGQQARIMLFKPTL